MTKKAEKKSFIMYDGWGTAISKMTDAQAGSLLKAIYEYREDPENPNIQPSDPAVEFVFEIIRDRLEEDDRKYQETCDSRAESGRLGGKASALKRKQKQANEANATFAKASEAKVSKPKQNEANQADNDNENDNDMTPLAGRNNARAREDTTETTAEDPEGLIYDKEVLRSMFHSDKVAAAMEDWLECRQRIGPFPPIAITDEIEKARKAEAQYGEQACVDAIRASLTFKRIAWDKLERKRSSRDSPPHSETYSDEHLHELEKELLA